MQISQIEAFVEIARQGSITRAADALFITQPTVTERLRALEKELGERLFTRDKYGVALTDAGKTLLPHAKRMLQVMAEARGAIENLAMATQGDLRLGSTAFINLYLLPAILVSFTNNHPGVRVSVHTANSSEDVLYMVLRDEVQIGFSRRLRHRDIEVVKLCDDESILVAARGHPFGELASVRIEQIAQEGVICSGIHTPYHRLLKKLFTEAGLVLKVRAQTDTPQLALAMVENGLGIAFLPRAAVQGQIESGVLVEVPVVDVPLPRRELAAIYRKASGLGGIARAFLLATHQALRFGPS